jgi:hypothetical protein
MPISDKIERTITCEAEGCPNTHVFNPQSAEDVIALPKWITSGRTLELGNRAKFFYCSDACTIAACKTDKHIIQEPPATPGPRLVQNPTQNEIKAAAIVEKVGQEQFKTLKTGKARRT